MIVFGSLTHADVSRCDDLSSSYSTCQLWLKVTQTYSALGKKKCVQGLPAALVQSPTA